MHDAEEIVDFYTGAGRDGRGRTLSEVWQLGLQDLEWSHDYIQWLFPLLEPSRAQPYSPVLTVAAADALRRVPGFRDRLLHSAEVMARFYGFSLSWDGLRWCVVPSPAFAGRKRVWLTPGNHNHLRHTRIMKSLVLLGLRPLAAAWLECLEGIYQADPSQVGRGTLGYWRAALE